MSDTAIVWDNTAETLMSIGQAVPPRYRVYCPNDGGLIIHTSDGNVTRTWYVEPTDVIVMGIDSVKCWTLSGWLNAQMPMVGTSGD